eukprot:6757134-Pyramimonas_sp.AAC.1
MQRLPPIFALSGNAPHNLINRGPPPLTLSPQTRPPPNRWWGSLGFQGSQRSLRSPGRSPPGVRRVQGECCSRPQAL